MVVAIHQPNFIPWLGYFYKMSKCDVFVLLDNVQYSKNSFINRNKIKTPQGGNWVTVPVLQSGKSGQLISETGLQNPDKSITTILRTIEFNYKKTPYFNQYYPGFAEAIQRPASNLADLNSNIILWVKEQLGIETRVIKASNLENIEGFSTDRLISICKKLGATKYLSGFGGQNYQEKELFEQEQIELIVYDFEHPVYPQLYGEFIPNLSVIDLLMNCGPVSGEVLGVKTLKHA